MVTALKEIALSIHVKLRWHDRCGVRSKVFNNAYAEYSGSIKIAKTGLNVSDIELSKAFYQEVLGLRVNDESHQLPLRYASMARDGRTLPTLWENTRKRLGNCPTTLHRMTFVANSTEEVNRTKRLLEDLGARWSQQDPLCSQASSSAVLHFEDPDGIPIELYSPGGETAALEDALTGSAKRTPGICSESLTTHKGIKNGRLI